jgi:hypothetical protein
MLSIMQVRAQNGARDSPFDALVNRKKLGEEPTVDIVRGLHID